MNRQVVQSSSISSIGYGEPSLTLEVEFHHGGTYQYLSVSDAVHLGFLNASSHGRFFQSHIRNRYSYIRVN
ncbi:KTSC domain-containing protein [Actinosynnema sp. CA-299493]